MKMRNVLATAVAGVAFGGWMTAPTQAASVSDAIAALLSAMDPLPNPPLDLIEPIVFEDDDFSFVTKATGNSLPTLQVGDKVSGILEVQAVRAGSPQGSLFAPGISKTTPSIPIGSGTLVNELTAAFELVVVGGGIDGGGNPFAILGAPAVFTEALAGVAGAVPGSTAIMLFEDSTPDFSTAGATFAADKATAVDGVLWANVGFTGVGSEFYMITDVPDVPTATGTTISEAVEFSLNFISGPPAPSAPWGGIAPHVNNFGTELYGSGQLKKYGAGSPLLSKYDRNSDIDAVVLYVPLPSAAWAGLGLLSALGGAHFWRRRRQA
jgi:hypothetical protein